MKRIPLKEFGIENHERALNVIQKINASEKNKVWLITDGKEYFLFMDDEMVDVVSAYVHKDLVKDLSLRVDYLEKIVGKIEERIKVIESNVIQQIQKPITVKEENVKPKPTPLLENKEIVFNFSETEKTNVSETENVKVEPKQFYCKKCKQEYTINVPVDKDIKLIKCPKGHTIYKKKKRRWLFG